MSVRVVIKEFTPREIVHALSEYVMRRQRVGSCSVETTCKMHYVVNKDCEVLIEGARVETQIEEEA